MDCCTLCHNGNRCVCSGSYTFAGYAGYFFCSQQIFNGEHLCGEETIECVEAESSAPAKEIGDM